MNTKRENEVMGAIVILGTDNTVNFSTIDKCNDILDAFREDFPDDPFSDFIDRFITACYNEDFRMICRCVQSAKDWLLDD